MSDRNDRRVLDAVVVGAGFSGIYMLHKLQEQGLRVRAFDRAGGIGGTWYWNRYPGAKSDTESFVYRYSFDADLLQEWNWTTRYLEQPEILAYLEHVVDRYQLRADIQLNTGIESAVFNEDTELWRIETDTGEVWTARYLVTALGVLSQIYLPDIPGRDTFAGELLHTAAWPEGHDLSGKRVGVVGTGSTGTQFICAASKIAGHLTVFQRSATYSVPSGNGPVTSEELARVKENYDEIWDQVRNSHVAFGFAESDVPAMSVSEDERRRMFEDAWDRGNGFRFMFSFGDIVLNPDANQAAADFIRSKIAEIVKDPETARKLMPSGYYVKRPVANDGYYESFNQDNVSLVSLKETPIVKITPKGVVTSDGVEHELDVLVFATGFDAVDGNYTRMNLRGRGDQLISDHWEAGPTSYLGVATAGFPNLFMAPGPHTAFTNLPPNIETTVEWIADLIAEAERRGATTVEVSQAAEEQWVKMCAAIADQTLFGKADSWLFGSNIPGKKPSVRLFMGGMGAFRQTMAQEAGSQYPSFKIQTPQPSLARSAAAEGPLRG
jgi:cation diffusion facilitator CzcD-associated flavoprotein CzcO